MSQQLRHFEINSTVRADCTFRNIDGDLTDPTTVTVIVISPTGERTNPSASNPSTGLYHASFTPTKAGEWVVRFEGTGDLVASSPDTRFIVNPSKAHQG